MQELINFIVLHQAGWVLGVPQVQACWGNFIEVFEGKLRVDFGDVLGIRHFNRMFPER